MRLVILQDWLRSGGTERQSVFLARFAAQRGHEVTLLTFRPGGVLAEDLAGSGVRLESLQRRDWGCNLWAPGLSKRLCLLEPDAVLCMGRIANAYAGVTRAVLPRARVFASVRTGKPLPWHNRRALGKVDGVIVNSRWWAECLRQEHGLESDRVHVVYNSLTRNWNFNALDEARVRMRSRYNVSEAGCVYVNVAGMRPGKRHDWLIECFAVLPQETSQLWIVGEGIQQLHCKSLADRLGVGERVKFVGYQPDPFDWLAAADVAVSASVEDAQPNFLVEAQWVGLPCVAVDVRGVGECFAQGKGGRLCERENAADFESAMRMYAEDAVLRAEEGKLARAYAREHFDPVRNAEACLRLLDGH